MTTENPLLVFIDLARLSFPQLDEAKPFQNNSENDPRYDATFLVLKGSADHKKIEAAISAAALKTYKTPEKAKAKIAALRGNSNKFCYTDGDLADKDGYEGHMVLSSHRKKKDGRPKVVDRNSTPVTPGDEGWPYAGCYVRGIVEIWAQDGQYPGIRATLIGVQFVKDGDSFAAGTSVAVADDFFTPLGVAEENQGTGALA